ncbi:small, acid-soluble spore protein L [Bacillus swezeyi]|uniref:Small, acid-soluble spore protein L n=2 Tax=Bacillus sonorensis TaxID=119858 RepID=M5PFP3_9BACI|nr:MULTISPECIES: small, acid-soluble spore protein L [Bacillus]TWK82492.1 Small, acid-soluble spore protein L [Bacillus paralicheniformis]ASB88775.1 Small, acid-soluble spore protein [Bacillus sonorensis]EME76415.1 small acid-soluble spore protein SspL [Bacillus sonorensis L12]MBG9915425.1 spore protein [Bacillus sonorensis]MCF7618129.1 small, acid-soluble spore protein L [Bacillus sonorensis]
MEKQKPAGKGRLTGGVTPQGDIEMNRHTDPKTELENRAKKSNTKH